MSIIKQHSMPKLLGFGGKSGAKLMFGFNFRPTQELEFFFHFSTTLCIKSHSILQEKYKLELLLKFILPSLKNFQL
jgi:hypothetical protein